MIPNIFSSCGFPQPGANFSPATREAAWRRLGFTPDNSPSGAWSEPPIDLEMTYRGCCIEVTPISPAGVEFLDGYATLVVPSDEFERFLSGVTSAGLVH